MFNPVSTYRIQFHKDFTFADFERIIPYLETLGINTIYASPIFDAVPGSTHGYDGLNPLKINPEIGTIAGLRRINKKLKAKGINWIQDIVPNHMAFHPNNAWLMDVLEKGPASVYKNYFDQSLSNGFFTGPIMVPFLGSDLNDVIDNGGITIELNKGKPVFNYAGQKWPIRKNTYPAAPAADEINKDKALLKEIANKQYYRLCSWKETNHVINFRRFFTVNGLICLKMQDDKVFKHFHRLIYTLLKEEVFQGLRVDHIDGLYDPAGYLEQLRNLTGKETYIIVEKILEKGEAMPTWPVQGNTGYDFLAVINNLLTNRSSETTFTDFYQKLTGDHAAAHEMITEKKRAILTTQMAGELDNLTHYFTGSGIVKEKELKNISAEKIKQAIAEFLIRCPVYRYYGNDFPLGRKENEAVKKIFSAINESNPQLKQETALLEKTIRTKAENIDAQHFYQRCMQFTGPLMAKGVEDTLMYTYNRFIAHNEVGDAPDAFGITAAEFHEAMANRQKHWPLSMNGTATHDTKRGEDVRARLNILTDLPGEWLQTVQEWQKINRELIKNNAPDANDEYFIYQTLLGAYPMPGETEDNFGERLAQYLEKTLREAKLHSDWAQPNEPYETAVKHFAQGLLNKKRPFWKSFTAFHQKISGLGVTNSLVQVLLKFTCPGVPDTYQGAELWDLSMVDPDNRRPVDYDLRSKQLQQLTQDFDVKQLWQNKYTGQIKLWLTHNLLEERKNNPLAFVEGEYIPLQAEGKYKDQVMAFARVYKHTWYLIAVPLNVASIGDDPLTIDWEDTRILMPENAPETYEDLLLNTKGKSKKEIPVSALFGELPFAFLKLQIPESHRGSGILLHITSLPSSFATGDFGPAAKAFARMLHKSHQKYWQILPVSPVDEKNQFSPYSAWSGMGGNTLLISPELLLNDGLLTGYDLNSYVEPETDQADFKTAGWLKEILFERAWQNYKTGKFLWLKQLYIQFCKSEAYWLNDFALYAALKKFHNGSPWYQWPDEFKLKHQTTLNEFAVANNDLIEKIKWLQFIFTRQWHQLKKYCNNLDIKLIGDLPFYVSYDSVDVWSYPEFFSLDKKLNMQLVAGVPPDYFNANGQLWGMPVFNWDALKAKNYAWWVNRIRKNLEFFYLLRLDHFRAFSSYWAVPAGEETAINGTWENGPGAHFFKVLKKELGQLPFIAEDLGDIDESVYQLRDEFNFPGMKVLQFAFGGNMPQSPHLPQNYMPNHVVYTGTHDNNTTKGWYRQDADKTVRKNIEKYTGFKITGAAIDEAFIKMALSSVAQTVIIPMQDVLGLDENARMNMPAGTDGNWKWRLTSGTLKRFDEKHLKKWIKTYNRV